MRKLMNRRVLRRVLLTGLMLGWGACTPMLPTTVKPTLYAKQPGLHVRVPEVHLSIDVRRTVFDESSRVIVVMQLLAAKAMKLDLGQIKLGLTDVTGHTEWRTPLASGLDEPPQLLMDDEHAGTVDLAAGKPMRVWVAFGEFKPRQHAEIPERIELVLPYGARERIVLSDPGHLPVWTGEPIARTQSLGLSMQLSQDESAMNIVLGESRFALEPLVFSYGYGIGVRAPQFPSRAGQEIVCCNVALETGLSWPLALSRELTIAPYLGFEAAVLASDDTVSRRTWLGPALGLELTGPPLTPRHGPFPVSYPRSLLSAYNVRLALVHWFGPDREAPSFGMTLSVGTAYGHY